MKPRDFHYRHFLPEVILQCLRWYLSYEVKTPWLNVKRNCFAKNGGIEIQETISVLQNFITREEFISSRYKNLRSSLEGKIQGAALILETSSN